MSVPFLAINMFFLLYERVQIAIESVDYLNDLSTYVVASPQWSGLCG